MDEQRRYRFLEDNRAVEQPGWLPPAAEVPALADLRADHDRLLDAVAETLAAAGALRRQRDAELESQRAAREAAFLGPAPEASPRVTVTQDEVAQAFARAEAARDALQTFAQRAIATIQDQESALLDQLDETVRAATTKRAEARAILAAAEAMEAGTRKVRNWLGRATGRSVLGQFAFEQLTAPDANGGAQNLTVAELYAAQNRDVGFEEIHEVADVSGAFGTDDPTNLDTDDAPWEQALTKEALHDR